VTNDNQQAAGESNPRLNCGLAGFSLLWLSGWGLIPSQFYNLITKRSKNMAAKNRNVSLSLIAAVVLSVFLTAANVSADDQNVILNPGYISGTVSLGDAGTFHFYDENQEIFKAKVWATGNDASGKELYAETWLGKDLGDYTLTVHVPESVTAQDYEVYCTVYYYPDCLHDRFNFAGQSLAVSDGETIPLNFSNSGYVSGTVTMTCKELKWGRLYVYEDGKTGTDYQTFVRFGADGNFHFPIYPDTDTRIEGYAFSTTGHQHRLESQNIRTDTGGTATVSWDILPEPCGVCDPSIRGNISIEGLENNAVERHWLYINDATYQIRYANEANLTYAFESVNTGDHRFWARSFLNKDSDGRYDDLFAHPDADSAQISVSSCDDNIHNLSSHAAFISGTITMGPLTVVTLPEDAVWDTFIHGHNRGGISINYGWYWILGLFEKYHEDDEDYDLSWMFRDQVDVSTGNYDMILAQGDWNVFYTTFHFRNNQCELCDPDNPKYVDSYLFVEDLERKKTENSFAFEGGELVNNHNISYETGSVTVKYHVNGGGTLTEPHLTAVNTDQTDYRVRINASGIPDETEEGEVTFIGLPGRYKVTAKATVNGSVTTFGDLEVEISAGGCTVTEIGAPVITIESPISYSTCNDAAGEIVEVSGTVDDEYGVTGVFVNESPVAFSSTGNPDKPNEVAFSTFITLESGANPVKITAENVFGKTASEIRTVQVWLAGVYTVGETGEIETDWLYDGGMYIGELGIFSLEGMGDLVPNSPEFIKEAARRALSENEDGHIIISDPAEGARFSGSLGEPQEWNRGVYTGVKTFAMRPGDRFATILAPNCKIQEIYDSPAVTDPEKRPLFSLASANPDHGMYIGQLADINGMRNAFIYEDMDFRNSDRDYNDFIFQIRGATVCLPLLDDLIDPDADWREMDAGQIIITHVDGTASEPGIFQISVSLDASAGLSVYDSEGSVCGKAATNIPGAVFATDENGEQIVFLRALENGDSYYRIVLLGVEDETCQVTVRGHLGDGEVLLEEIKAAEIGAHQVLKADVSVSLSDDSLEIIFRDMETASVYDPDGNGKTDDGDIAAVSSKWNATCGDSEYDPFFDLDDDCYIGILDIMPFVNNKTR
jgi:hypothetical protein